MTKPLLDTTAIQARIPHRAPILMVDNVLEYTPQKTLTAERHFPKSDPLFQGHFPGMPLLPGVLVCEAIAQTGALLVALDRDLKAGEATYLFAGLDKVRFTGSVLPGDTLTLHITKKFEKLGVFGFDGWAEAHGKKCATASFTAKLVLNK